MNYVLLKVLKRLEEEEVEGGGGGGGGEGTSTL